MNNIKSKSSRKKFIKLSAITLLTGFVFKRFSKLTLVKSENKSGIKMLSEDGNLVEIDEKYIQKTGIKINNDAIHNWIKK